ncbi:MAG: DEDD exonuclease domain-containing protein, partial [Nitriliruptoraceae bacterium]|nr:DEDD exonuclease domain-containing protein [Nitriliruptoraceae bacterium]
MPRTGIAQQLGFESLGTPLFDTTFVVLDLETTGLSSQRDRITEIGAVKVRGGEVLGELRTFVHPGAPIPPAITAVTGITDAMVRDAPSLPAIWPTVRRFLGDAVFVAHNAAFDLGFLRAAVAECHDDAYEPLVVDTARLARRLVRDEVRNCRLSTLATHFRARTRPEHRALADARATVDVLHGLIERAGSLGATTVEDLRDLTRSSSDKAFRRRDLVADAPASCGVYRFLDERDEVLYVGKATDLRQRLRTYFGQDPRRRIADMVRETARVTWETTPTLLGAEVAELRAIHASRPRYNRRSTTPQAAVHLAVTREAFPRLSIVREPRSSHAATFGPFPTRRIAERVLEAIHEVVPLRTCSTRLRRAQDHPACVLKDLGRCGAPCDGSIDADAHAEVVANAVALFTDPTPLFDGLRATMQRLAADGRYEEAARARRRLHGAATALQAARRHRTTTAPALLVAARAEGDDRAVVAVRGGLLATSIVVPGAPADRQALRRRRAARPAGPLRPAP